MIKRGFIISIVAAVTFLGDCSGKKAVEEENEIPPPVKTENERVVEQPAPAGPVTEEGKEGPVPVQQEEMTVSVPEQDSKIDIVLPESKEDVPIIEAGEAKKDAVSILEIIKKLEKTYEQDDFIAWQSMLTPAYREKYSNPDNLHREGWDADDLRSFFNLLVDTRRKGKIKALKISRVEFVNPDKAYIYVFFKNREFPEPQHTFIRINGTWLKGLREEE